MGLKIAIGADHGGLPLKDDLSPWLKAQGFELLDVGAATLDPADDYPDYAVLVAQAVAADDCQRGIIICGSGVGACIVANKVPGVRAAIAHDVYTAAQGVEHDDMNVLCLGARVIGPELARELVTAFLGTAFTAEERHLRRLNKVLGIEARYTGG
jgi:ribose 5-phosphate isomerase B